MKISLIVSAVLALLIVALGWRNQEQISAVRETHAKLVAEADHLGISGTDGAGAATGTARRDRPDRGAAAKATAAELVAFAKEMEALEKSGGKPEDMEKFQLRVLGFMERMVSLSPAESKALIEEFRKASGISDETRHGLISFALTTLSNQHPEAALELLTSASELFPDSRSNQYTICSTLARWGRQDAPAALEWVRANGGKYPALIDDAAKMGLISGISLQDPKLAFKLIGEFGITTSDSGAFGPIAKIIRAAKTPAQRSAAIAAFREHLSGTESSDQKEQMLGQAFGTLATQLAPEGFASATTWLSGANLSPPELDVFLRNLNTSAKTSEKGQWMQWITDTLPEDKATTHIQNMFGDWTRDDYVAAGKWLVSTPDGLIKNAAINTYIIAVAPYEPETAGQWALTLPAGPSRDGNLGIVYRDWLKKDPVAAAAFAEKHGIK